MLEREARIAAMMDDEASDTSEDEEGEDDFGDDGFDFGHDDYLEAEELDSSSDFESEDKSLLYDTTYLQEPQKSGFSIGTSFRNLTSGMTDSVSAIPDENLLQGVKEEEEGILRTCTPNFHNDEVRSHEDCLVQNLVDNLVDHPKPNLVAIVP